MNSPEATAEHLLTILALDDSGRGELAKRGYNSGAAFNAAYLSLLSKNRLSNGMSPKMVVTSDDLTSIMANAAAIAQGFEKSARAIATSDIVEAIASRDVDDAIKALLSAKVAKTAAEEARDGVREIFERLAPLCERAETTDRRVGELEQHIADVQTLATKTANENDVRWARATAAGIAFLMLAIGWASYLVVHGIRLVQVALAG
jgi:hypothetical protein